MANDTIEVPEVVAGAFDQQQRIRMLYVKEVARVLRISTWSAYELIRTGELRAARFGRNLRVSAADLDDYIARGYAANEQHDG